MMNAATAENTGDAGDVVDYEWETLSAAEIYDAGVTRSSSIFT